MSFNYKKAAIKAFWELRLRLSAWATNDHCIEANKN